MLLRVSHLPTHADSSLQRGNLPALTLPALCHREMQMTNLASLDDPLKTLQLLFK